MSEEKEGEGKSVDAPAPATDSKSKDSEYDDDDDDAGVGTLDEAQRKFKAAALRKEAIDIDGEASKLREQAVELEKKAAKLRIKAWKAEGAISAVSNEIVKGVEWKSKYEKELAELDLMAKDWVDEDTEKWEWYQQQRQMILDMMNSIKESDELAEEQINDLKRTLGEIQEIFNIECVDKDSNITAAGWVFVVFSFVIPIWIGYTLFEGVFGLFEYLGSGFKSNDPFQGL